MKQFCLPTILLLTLNLFGQGYEHVFGVGTWREHLPYTNVIKVEKLGEKIYAATNSGMYYVDLEDNSMERVTKINMLSDFEVSAMDVNSSKKTLVIGYSNGNVDLLKGDKIVNISAIAQSNIIGDKGIKNIHNSGKLAYLACGFGIVVIDIEREEVKDTYIIGPGGSQIKINDITTNQNYIYAATETGLFKADVNHPYLSDFNLWSQDAGLPVNTNYSLVATKFDKVFCAFSGPQYHDDSIYINKNGNWDKAEFFNADYRAIEDDNENGVVLAHDGGVFRLDTAGLMQQFHYLLNGTESMSANACFQDGDATWVGDQFHGLNKVMNSWSAESFLLSGPDTKDLFHIAASNGNLWVATGRVYGTYLNPSYSSRGIYTFDGFDWGMITRKENPDLMSVDSSVFDIVYVTPDPKDKTRVFASSYMGGLLEIKDNVVVNRYATHNSSLQKSLLDPGIAKVRVYGTAFDSNDNLWVANSYCTKPLSVMTPDGTWKSFSCGSAGNDATLMGMMIDKQYGYIWISIKNVGLLVYNCNNTPLDASDDEYKLLIDHEGQGDLPSKLVLSMAEDRDGEIWIGTDKGPAVIYNIAGLFSDGGNYDAQQILIDQDGVIQLLLENESISSIVVDGGDRKWFGTESGGVFLMSEDGTRMLETFTENNSPLFSNEIISMAMNEETGELYIGTIRGLMGYKGEATEPAGNFSEIYASPNPVRPEYTGYIAVNGLMEDSDIKITDAAGNLVYATTSKGGQFIWSGNTLRGERVKSGVYYIFAADRNGRTKASTKLLFIN